MGAIAAQVAWFTRWPEIASGPAGAVVAHPAAHAESHERDENAEDDERPEDVHQVSSGNTSDFTMTGTTPLGATGAPTSM